MYSTCFGYEIGDKVRMEMDSEARSWGRKGQPDGTVGEVVRFHRPQMFRARWGIDTFSYPNSGIYEMNSALVVRWDDGTESIESYDVKPVDQAKYDHLREERWFSQIKHLGHDNMREIERKLSSEIRISDLPETLYWEGDLIKTQWNGEVTFALITSINYHYLDQVRSDGLPLSTNALYDFRFVDVNGKDLRGGSAACGDIGSELIRRGNLWKFYHGEPLEFRDIHDEIEFAQGRHQYMELRNPATNNYAWSGKEALDAVRSGYADGMSMSTGFFGMTPKPYPCKFFDRDLGERVRQMTIAGFVGCDDPDELRKVA